MANNDNVDYALTNSEKQLTITCKDNMFYIKKIDTYRSSENRIIENYLVFSCEGKSHHQAPTKEY